MWKKFLAVALISGIIMGCGENGEASGPVVIQTEGLEPTPIVEATAVPGNVPTAVSVQPTADIEAILQQRLAEIAAEVPTPDPTPTNTPVPVPTSVPVPSPMPTATPAPTPTPTQPPIVRPISPPASGGSSVLRVSDISILNRTLRISGSIEGRNFQPTSIQVWQSQERNAYSDTCSTDRPVAFLRPGNGSVIYSGQDTDYQWNFCRNGYNAGQLTDSVPWLYSQAWTYTERPIVYIWDPIVQDFSVVATLNHDLVKRLEYGSGLREGWRVIVFAGDQVILNQWIDY